MTAPSCLSPSTKPEQPVQDPDNGLRARRLVADGCAHEGNQDWESAVAAYQAAVDLEPRDLTVRYFAHNNLGYSLIQLGRFDEAEEHCEAAIVIAPGRHNAHKNLGLAREGQGRWLDAALSLAEAAHLQPLDTRAWLYLQKLLSARPALTRQSTELAEVMARVRAHYETDGRLPRLN